MRDAKRAAAADQDLDGCSEGTEEDGEEEDGEDEDEENGEDDEADDSDERPAAPRAQLVSGTCARTRARVAPAP